MQWAFCVNTFFSFGPSNYKHWLLIGISILQLKSPSTSLTTDAPIQLESCSICQYCREKMQAIYHRILTEEEMTDQMRAERERNKWTFIFVHLCISKNLFQKKKKNHVRGINRFSLSLHPHPLLFPLTPCVQPSLTSSWLMQADF